MSFAGNIVMPKYHHVTPLVTVDTNTIQTVIQVPYKYKCDTNKLGKLITTAFEFKADVSCSFFQICKYFSILIQKAVIYSRYHMEGVDCISEAMFVTNHRL